MKQTYFKPIFSVMLNIPTINCQDKNQ